MRKLERCLETRGTLWWLAAPAVFMILVMLVFLALAAMLPGRSAHAAEDCEVTEQSGCLELGVTIYEPSSNSLIKALIAGRKESGDVVHELWQARQDSTAGVVVEDSSYSVKIFVWEAEAVEADQLRLYWGGAFNSSEPSFARTLEWPLSDKKRSFAIISHVNNGEVSLQVPYSMIGPNTEILICVDADLAYPKRKKGESGEGLRISDSLRRFVQKGWDTMSLAMVAAN